MDKLEYTLLRSNRRTVGMEINGGKLIVRAPYSMSREAVKRFVAEHEPWIRKHLALEAEQRKGAAQVQKLTGEEIAALADRALAVIPERVRHYAPIVGVTYGGITIRNQRTKWGSCSAKGNLNFNCLLMLAPPEVVDAIVVHELCHRKEMNHSQRFYEEVRRVFPDYDKWNGWLKDHGQELMSRMC